MQNSVTSLLIYVGLYVLSGAVGIFGFLLRTMLKSMYARIDDLEVRMREAVSEDQVRTIVSDKYEPLQEQIQKMDIKLDKLLDMYVDSLKNSRNEGKDNG